MARRRNGIGSGKPGAPCFGARGLPLAVFLPLLFGHPAALLLLLVYPLQVLRLALRLGVSTRRAWQESLLLVLGRFPEAQGILHFWFRRLAARPGQLIEYK